MPRNRRNQTLGKFQSRDELEYWVRRWYFNESNTSQTDVARMCGISPTTAKTIISRTTTDQRNACVDESDKERVCIEHQTS